MFKVWKSVFKIDRIKKDDIVLSEYKGFSLIKEFLLEIKNSIYRGQNSLSRLLNRIINVLISKGKKSKKKGKKTSAEIVVGIRFFI